MRLPWTSASQLNEHNRISGLDAYLLIFPVEHRHNQDKDGCDTALKHACKKGRKEVSGTGAIRHEREDRIPRSSRRAKKGPNDLGIACNIMIAPQATMLAPRYFPSRSRCAMYIEGKTQIKNPRRR